MKFKINDYYIDWDNEIFKILKVDELNIYCKYIKRNNYVGLIDICYGIEDINNAEDPLIYLGNNVKLIEILYT